jgi:hypothetical protein
MRKRDAYWQIAYRRSGPAAPLSSRNQIRCTIGGLLFVGENYGRRCF